VAGAVAGIQPGEPGAGIRVQADVAGAPVLRGDAEAIREMLASLVANAVEAMPQGGALTVRARAGVGEVRLEVSDTGVGMSEEVRRRCLEPFFSTKGRRGGGLGLPLVHVTVERHGGTLRIESVPGRGTTVTVRLPPVPRA
jgi:signal transduction histidine kinase